MSPTISRSQARARGRQHLDMAGMQNIEAAIGETDAQSLLAPVRQMRIEIAAGRHDLLLGRQRRMRQDFPPQFRRRHGSGALLADRNGSRRIRHPQRGLPVGPGRKRQRQRRSDRVARARDVAHLDRQRRHMDRLAAANHQRHAVFALRHQHRLAVGENHRVLRRGGNVLVGIGAAAGGFGKFLAIGRQQRGAAIDREIGALGIDDHALAELLARRR